MNVGLCPEKGVSDVVWTPCTRAGASAQQGAGEVGGDAQEPVEPDC